MNTQNSVVLNVMHHEANINSDSKVPDNVVAVSCVASFNGSLSITNTAVVGDLSTQFMPMRPGSNTKSPVGCYFKSKT